MKNATLVSAQDNILTSPPHPHAMHGRPIGVNLPYILNLNNQYVQSIFIKNTDQANEIASALGMNLKPAGREDVSDLDREMVTPLSDLEQPLKFSIHESRCFTNNHSPGYFE